jgi:hypothetical protein
MRSFYQRCVARCVHWMFPWLIPPPVMTLTEFNHEELWRWIMPEEFSFGPNGWLESLQPVPPKHRTGGDVDVSHESHELRVRLAVLRKRLGCPPIYWKH